MMATTRFESDGDTTTQLHALDELKCGRCELVALACCASSLGFAPRFEPLDGASVGRFQLRARSSAKEAAASSNARRVSPLCCDSARYHADQLLVKSRGILRADTVLQSRRWLSTSPRRVLLSCARQPMRVPRAQRCHLIFVQPFARRAREHSRRLRDRASCAIEPSDRAPK